MTGLFDFDFNTLVTPKVLRVLYLLNVVLISLVAGASLIALVASLASDREFVLVALGIFGITLSYFVLLLIMRMVFESILIRFRVAEDIQHLRRKFADIGPAREILYDLEGWEPVAITGFTEALTTAGIGFAFENSELVIDSVDESRVDVLIDQFEPS